MVNEKAVLGLEPVGFWKYLAEIAEIPRGSGNEEGVRKYILSLAVRFGFETKIDKVGNVLVKKPAFAGRENAPSTALQGHMDMVNEKNGDVVHDFLKDPIQLVRDGKVMRASGTSAGFDDGVGVAAMCALMEDRGIKHGPLELLFTVDEETGLTGANNLEPGFIVSRTLLNLDTEQEGELYIGCAGGRQIAGTISYPRISAPVHCLPYIIRVSGLPGGHSGVQIHEKHRVNALKILGKTLRFICGGGDVFLSTISGGDKHNAIPREAEAMIFIPESEFSDVERKVKEETAALVREHTESEQDFDLKFERAEEAADKTIFVKEGQDALIKLLSDIPNGVVKMSETVPGLVETSTSLAVVTFENGVCSVVTSQRSSVSSELEKICDRVAGFLSEAKMEVRRGEGYPGWEPNPNSPLLLKAKGIYETLFGKTPEIKAIHAGLECGVIGHKYPGIDMLSIGASIENPHSPDEILYIESVPKFWKLLVGILEG